MQKLEEKALKKNWKNWKARLGQAQHAFSLSMQHTFSAKKAHEEAQRHA